jgi:hypothetical protein
MWFYYDKDWTEDGDQESYTFFAVHDKTIVSERCHFSSEEPLILIRRTIIRSGAAILSSMRP